MQIYFTEYQWLLHAPAHPLRQENDGNGQYRGSWDDKSEHKRYRKAFDKQLDTEVKEELADGVHPPFLERRY